VSDGRCLAGLGRGSELGSRAGCSAAGPAMGRPSSGFAWIYAGGSSGAASQRPRGFRLGTWSEGSQSWGREEEGAAGREEGVAPHLEPQAGSERPVRTGAGWGTSLHRKSMHRIAADQAARGDQATAAEVVSARPGREVRQGWRERCAGGGRTEGGRAAGARTQGGRRGSKERRHHQDQKKGRTQGSLKSLCERTLPCKKRDQDAAHRRSIDTVKMRSNAVNLFSIVDGLGVRRIQLLSYIEIDTRTGRAR